MRKPDAEDKQGRSLAAQGLADGVKAFDLGVANSGLEGQKEFLGNKASLANKTEANYGRGAALFRAAYGALDSTLGDKFFSSSRKNGEGGSDPTGAGIGRKFLNGAADTADAAARVSLGNRSDRMALESASQGQNMSWQMKANGLQQGALKDSGGKLASNADFEAQSAAWEARNDFAAHASAMAGVAGMNAGSLSPGEKPMNMEQLAVSGMLDGYSATADGKGGFTVANSANNASDSAWYSKEGLPAAITSMRDKGISEAGSAALTNSWNEGGGFYSAFGSGVKAGQSAKEGKNFFSEADANTVGAKAADISTKFNEKMDELPELVDHVKTRI
jgi:hypothetical protein